MAFTWNDPEVQDEEIDFDTIQEVKTNLDSIHDHLANITHDSSYLTTYHPGYLDAHLNAVDSTQYSTHETDYYVGKDDTLHSNYENSDRTSEKTTDHPGYDNDLHSTVRSVEADNYWGNDKAGWGSMSSDYNNHHGGN